jgi:hypothetical protein
MFWPVLMLHGSLPESAGILGEDQDSGMKLQVIDTYLHSVGQG